MKGLRKGKRILFLLPLLGVLFFLCGTAKLSAFELVSISEENSSYFMQKLRQADQRSIPSIRDALGLSALESLRVVRSRTDEKGFVSTRYQQLYLGFPITENEILIRTNPKNEVVGIYGSLVWRIPADLATVNRAVVIDPRETLSQMKADYLKLRQGTLKEYYFANEFSATVIWADPLDQKAKLINKVGFFADVSQQGMAGDPSFPNFYVDAVSGNIIYQRDNLIHYDGTGPGGNLKVGKYQYGTDYPPFQVTNSGTTCTMNTTNVKTVNLNGGSSGTTAYSFTCPTNTVKEINGAYSPLNDAQYFGTVIFNMYSQWFNTAPLTQQLVLKVHYSTNYENAFWDGSSMTFGDGYNTFHPLVCLDVTAHEVSHGFTQQNSGLNYSGQSGGINEAFSDMAGESAEFFMRNTNDYIVGYDIVKAAGKGLRYMYDPPLDGKSIGSVNDYTSSMDVHYSSGVFNKAFHRLATTAGWTTKMAFAVFVKANQDFWTASTNFQQGAEGARDAAMTLGYSCNDVKNAFAQVDITITCTGGGPNAAFDATTYGGSLKADFLDKSACSECQIIQWNWNFGDNQTSNSQNPSHTYSTAGTYTISLTVTSNQSPAQTSSVSKNVSVPKNLTVGYTDVYGSTSTSANRRALPVTMPENGKVTGISIHHDGGSGKVLVALYEGDSSPTNRLAISSETALSGSAGWQTIPLSSTPAIAKDKKFWLAWVFETTGPGMKYQTGTPGRVDAGVAWSGGMPATFGTGTPADFIYSVYATYVPESSGTIKEGFAGNFSGSGVWNWNPNSNSWMNWNKLEASLLASGDINGNGIEDVAGVYGTSGLWIRLDSGTWQQVTGAGNPTALATADLNNDGQDDLLGVWPGIGVWVRTSGTNQWAQVHTKDALHLAGGDFDKDGRDDLLGVWDPEGIWIKYATGSWAKILDKTNLLTITSCDFNGDQRADILGNWTHGIWTYDLAAASWARIHDAAEKIAAGDLNGDAKDDLIGTWAAVAGTWVRYSNGAWAKIHDSKATCFTAGKLN